MKRLWLTTALFAMLLASSAFAQCDFQQNGTTLDLYLNCGSGKVGIGTQTPGNYLHVTSGAADNNVFGIFERKTPATSVGLAIRTTNPSHQWLITKWSAANNESLFFFGGSAGYANPALTLTERKIGIGTNNPFFTLHVTDPTPGTSTYLLLERVGSGVDGGLLFRTAGESGSNQWYVGKTGQGDNQSLYFQFGPQPTPTTLVSYWGGLNRVGIGIGNAQPSEMLEVGGNIHAQGTISGANVIAKYQDIAEWVPSEGEVTNATVVVINPERGNGVMPSTHSYDTRVAGVVSAQPGIVLGEKETGKSTIATTGRVLVRADARQRPIAVGDLLVTSDVPGTAMRSEPVSLNGIPMHRPGTIIGKALQALPSGEGEILVLLSLQ